MSAELSVELAEATLYADDGASEVVKEFQSGTLTLGIDNIGTAVAEDLTGATIDKTRCWFPHLRTEHRPLQSVFVQRKRTASIVTSGFTE